MGGMELAELRRQAWQISIATGESGEIRRYTHVIDEACERQFEIIDAEVEAERAAEDERYAWQVLAWAA